MNDTSITVVGNVVDSPRLVRTQNGSVTNFRMASTARRYDAASGSFVDGNTLWIDVECWGELSGHVSGCVSKGDPVIVRGDISTHNWQTDDGPRSKPRIRARAVGHDLAKGTARFTRIKTVRAVGAGEGAGPVVSPHAGPLGDDADEAYADGVDPMTGELLDAGEDGERLVRGRDYLGADAALHEATAGDRSPEPVHA